MHAICVLSRFSLRYERRVSKNGFFETIFLDFSFIKAQGFIEETLASLSLLRSSSSSWSLTNVESRIGDNVTNDDRPSPSFAPTNLLITAYKPSIDSTRLETWNSPHVCLLRNSMLSFSKRKISFPFLGQFPPVSNLN